MDAMSSVFLKKAGVSFVTMIIEMYITSMSIRRRFRLTTDFTDAGGANLRIRLDSTNGD